MFYGRRERMKKLAEAEARGESLWTAAFSQRVRTRLLNRLGQLMGGDLSGVASRARALILLDEGGFHLHEPNLNGAEDFLGYWLESTDAAFPTVLEATYQALIDLGQSVGYYHYFREFHQAVEDILAEERVSFDFVGGEMVPFASKELHEAVVEPTLRLLSGHKEMQSVEQAYQKALREVGAGDPSDAITDAATALQEFLVALGCDGNSLGPLLASARKKRLFGSHDYPLLEVMIKAVDWVSADRNALGDAHKAGAATRPDAWLTIHLVGAIIVRLIGGGRSGQ